MKFILPIFGMICCALATLTAVVFCMGMGANATPAQIRVLKLWMAGLGLLGVAGVTISFLLLRAGQMNWAIAAAFAPIVIMGIILAVALAK